MKRAATSRKEKIVKMQTQTHNGTKIDTLSPNTIVIYVMSRNIPPNVDLETPHGRLRSWGLVNNQTIYRLDIGGGIFICDTGYCASWDVEKAALDYDEIAAAMGRLLSPPDRAVMLGS